MIEFDDEDRAIIRGICERHHIEPTADFINSIFQLIIEGKEGRRSYADRRATRRVVLDNQRAAAPGDDPLPTVVVRREPQWVRTKNPNAEDELVALLGAVCESEPASHNEDSDT